MSKPDVTITHHAQGQGGKYIAHVEGAEATGYLEWEPRETGKDDVRVATHTVVPRAIGGRGVGTALVENLIAEAREHDFKIVPQCSFVAEKFDEHPEWAELRA